MGKAHRSAFFEIFITCFMWRVQCHLIDMYHSFEGLVYALMGSRSCSELDNKAVARTSILHQASGPHVQGSLEYVCPSTMFPTFQPTFGTRIGFRAAYSASFPIFLSLGLASCENTNGQSSSQRLSDKHSASQCKPMCNASLDKKLLPIKTKMLGSVYSRKQDKHILQRRLCMQDQLARIQTTALTFFVMQLGCFRIIKTIFPVDSSPSSNRCWYSQVILERCLQEASCISSQALCSSNEARGSTGKWSHSCSYRRSLPSPSLHRYCKPALQI
jgi:hypothetical protein